MCELDNYPLTLFHPFSSTHVSLRHTKSCSTTNSQNSSSCLPKLATFQTQNFYSLFPILFPNFYFLTISLSFLAFFLLAEPKFCVFSLSSSSPSFSLLLSPLSTPLSFSISVHFFHFPFILTLAYPALTFNPSSFFSFTHFLSFFCTFLSSHEIILNKNSFLA